MSTFTFKQFSIEQDACAMKVGTDGVLLGAWCQIDGAQSVLDIGTGTGLLALMVAQRNAETTIDAIEIDENATKQATENVNKSKFAGRIEVVCKTAQEYAQNCTKRYDAIVCNPPYFVNSLVCPNAERMQARHCTSLTFDELLDVVSALLAENGVFSVIIPADIADEFAQKAEQRALQVTRVLHVYPTPNADEKRRLLTFSRKGSTLEEQKLVIEVERHNYTAEYKKLTKDFYLKF